MPEQCPENYTHNVPDNRMRRITTRTANILITAALLPAGSFYEGDDAERPYCAVVSEQEITQTEALLEQPDIPGIASIRTMDKRKSDNQLVGDLAQVSAHKEGLHLNSGFTYLNTLQADAKHGYKMPFSAYFDAAKDYYGVYNIAVTAKDPASFMGTDFMGTSDAKPLTAAELETTTAKQDIIDLLEASSHMPEEYLAFAGVRTVVFDRDAIASGWYAKGGKGAFSVNLTDKDSGGDANHEVFHGISEQLCTQSHANATIANDREIADQNIQDYTDYCWVSREVPTISGYFDKKEVLNSSVKHGAITRAEADKELAAYGEQVSFTDNYGRTNPAEDAAQIGRLFGVPWARETLLSPAMPHLRAKAIIWLTRLREQAPRLFAYVNDIIPPIAKTK